MSKFFLILSAFAMIVSVTVCVSHAHADVDTGSELSISIDSDSPENSDSSGNNDSDIFCVGCCVHHAANISHGNSDLASLSKGKLLVSDTTLVMSDFIYGLKRPPKS